MTWNLFLDDERFAPTNSVRKYVYARTYEEAVRLVEANGCPEFISFDHDLGNVLGAPRKTGMDFAKWLVANDYHGFDWQVHSQNPIGAANIDGLLIQYKAHWPQQ